MHKMTVEEKNELVTRNADVPAYRPFPTPCDVSEVSLMEAAHVVGPSFVYILFVHPEAERYVAKLLRRLDATHQANPFAPRVNLTTVPGMKRDEWVLSANGKAAGSVGA